MDRAACRREDPEIFFSTDKLHTRWAIDVCGGCEVLNKCRLYARRIKPSDGVWAGTERSRQ